MRFRLGQAQEAQIAELFEHLVGGEDFRLLPFVHVRVDFGVNKALEGFLHFEMFVGPLHGVSPGGVGYSDVLADGAGLAKTCGVVAR